MKKNDESNENKEYNEYKSIFLKYPEYKDHKNQREEDNVNAFKIIAKNTEKFNNDFKKELKTYENIHALNQQFMKHLINIENKFEKGEKLSYQQAYTLLKANKKVLIDNDKYLVELRKNLGLFLFCLFTNYWMKTFVRTYLDSKMNVKYKSTIDFQNTVNFLKRNRRISNMYFFMSFPVLYYFYNKNANHILFNNLDLNKEILKSLIKKRNNK